MLATLYAHAKINWALNITGRRGDGYHLLDMLMQSIDLCDALRLEEADSLSLSVNGAPAREDDLVLGAARALLRRAGIRRGARMELTKVIPERAGLGGGSADCALALRALNEMWELKLSRAELLEIGGRIGADVPFCLTGGLARVSGIGEVIEPVDGAPQIPLVLARVGDGLSTAEVFSLWDRDRYPAVDLDVPALAKALQRRDLREADRLCANALTAPAVALMPGIGEGIRRLRTLGAQAAFMTGSGSAVVGAFEDEETARCAAAGFPGAILTRTMTGARP